MKSSAERRRIGAAVHAELDELTDLTKKLIAAQPLVQNDLEALTLSILREVVRYRIKEVSIELKRAGIAEPKVDKLRN